MEEYEALKWEFDRLINYVQTYYNMDATEVITAIYGASPRYAEGSTVKELLEPKIITKI